MDEGTSLLTKHGFNSHRRFESFTLRHASHGNILSVVVLGKSWYLVTVKGSQMVGTATKETFCLAPHAQFNRI